MAAQVISRMRSAFALEPPLYALFEAPTIAGQAEKIEAGPEAEAAASSPPTSDASEGGGPARLPIKAGEIPAPLWRRVAIGESPPALPLVVLELSALPEAERAAEARRIVAEEAQDPFDLSRSPLLRAKLLRLGDQEHLFLLVTHHIACDGWSMGVFC